MTPRAGGSLDLVEVRLNRLAERRAGCDGNGQSGSVTGGRDVGDAGRDIGLYLVVEASEGAVARLEAVLAAVPAAAVCIAPGKDRAAPAKLVAAAQSAGAAALVDGDARLSVALGSDGVHLPWSEDVLEAYAAARAIVGAQGNVGGMAGGSRHDAMSLGEAGADYVGFGGPDPEARAELVAWWAELFEVPCVAFDVTSASEAESLARSGADFIGVSLPPGETVEAAVARIRQMSDAIRRAAAGGAP
jgi:thiamine-phosphate pyrophosphorylase